MTSGRLDRSAPVRTCIGCRERADKTTLMRLVLRDGVVTVDEGGSLPGRGAHLHRDSRCLELARRRRAFGRAFKTEGPFDTGSLETLLDPGA